MDKKQMDDFVEKTVKRILERIEQTPKESPAIKRLEERWKASGVWIDKNKRSISFAKRPVGKNELKK